MKRYKKLMATERYLILIFVCVHVWLLIFDIFKTESHYTAVAVLELTV